MELAGDRERRGVMGERQGSVGEGWAGGKGRDINVVGEGVGGGGFDRDV